MKLTRIPNHKKQAKDRALRVCLRRLDFIYARWVKALRPPPSDPACLAESMELLSAIAELRNQIVNLATSGNAKPQQALAVLRQSNQYLETKLQAQPPDRLIIRQGLSEILELFITTESRLAALLSQEPSGSIRTIHIEIDLLYQAFHSLFPPERMLVVSGRKYRDKLNLGAVFDVTGVNSAGHVRAEPQNLAQALIAMDLSNTHLAAWIHSHPGSGAMATLPSAIDREQHQDWIQDYSPDLVSAIMVSDRWIRFWGSALDENQVVLEFGSSGLLKENENDRLYRLT